MIKRPITLGICATLLLLSACAPAVDTVNVSPDIASARATRQPTMPVPKPSASPACRQPWQDGLRRPQRFTLVVSCAVVVGTVRHVKAEQDGDFHIQVVLDPPGDQYVNDRNRAAQSGALVWEIEPWQRGVKSTALGADKVNEHAASAYCNAACNPQPGDRVRITSAIVTDNEGGHGWVEAHAPSNVELVGKVAAPSRAGIEHPSDEPD